MKRFRVLVVSMLLLLVGVSGVFATFATRPSISGWAGGVFCHPTAEYLKEYPGDPTVEMPPLRTSFSFGFDLKALDLCYCFDEESGRSISVNTGLSFLHVSESLPYGVSVLKPYTGIGVIVGIGYRFNHRYSVDLNYRYLLCHFSGSTTGFVAMEFEASPSMKVLSSKHLDFSLHAPVTVSWKADALSLRASVALSVAFDSRRMPIRKGGEK